MARREVQDTTRGDVIKAAALRDHEVGRSAARAVCAAEPRVDFEKVDGLVRRIRVTCGCGQEIVVDCEYEDSGGLA